MIALVALAHAGSLPVAIEAGVSHDVNLPFERIWGLGVDAHVGVPAVPWLGAGVTLTVHPIGGQGGESDPAWSPLSKQLLMNNSVIPSISSPRMRLAGFVRATPFRTTLGRDGMATGVRAGLGAVWTDDDLVALQMEGEPAAMAVERQMHLAPQLGWFGEAWRGHVGVAAHVDVLRYTEETGGPEEEGGAVLTQTPMFFEIALRIGF